MPRLLGLGLIERVLWLSLSGFGSEWDRFPTAWGFLYRLIPALILAALVVFCWKRRIAGGAAYIFAGLVLKAGLMLQLSPLYYGEPGLPRFIPGAPFRWEVVGLALTGGLLLIDALHSGELGAWLKGLVARSVSARARKNQRRAELTG